MTTEPNAAPDLSVIVAIVSDTTNPNVDLNLLKEALKRLVSEQNGSANLEIIVPYLNHVKGIEELATSFPSVHFLAVDAPDMSRYMGGGREHHDLIRARGLDVATGRIVALLEDHALADPNWSRAVLEAHKEPHAGIGGAVENAADTALNWAVYFCDFARYQNPVPEGPTYFASDANTSYKREALRSIREVWRESFREVIVNGAFRDAGQSVVLDPSIVASQNRRYLTFWQALKERFVWGRSFAATRNRSLSFPKRLVYALAAPILPFLLFFRLGRITFSRKNNAMAYLRAAPITIVLLLVWSAGEFTGYLFGINE